MPNPPHRSNLPAAVKCLVHLLHCHSAPVPRSCRPNWDSVSWLPCPKLWRTLIYPKTPHIPMILVNSVLCTTPVYFTTWCTLTKSNMSATLMTRVYPCSVDMHGQLLNHLWATKATTWPSGCPLRGHGRLVTRHPANWYNVYAYCLALHIICICMCMHHLQATNSHKSVLTAHRTRRHCHDLITKPCSLTQSFATWWDTWPVEKASELG